jgi:geranylgeranyl pyrophosphate synthase
VVDQACKEILSFSWGDEAIDAALKYYALNTLPSVLPIFPTLSYVSCRLVGGKPEKTQPVAKVLMIIAASADIHDDVIDRSTHKFENKTLYGKFGDDLALLAGDALLTRGLTLLSNCKGLSVAQRKAVAGLVEKATLKMIKAEALETRLRKQHDLAAHEFFEDIKLKSSVAELQCRIGGMVGNADGEDLDDVAEFGRVIGVLATVKEEFVDLQNPAELRHRLKYELPPYPVVYALQDERLKTQILPVIGEKNPTNKQLQSLVDAVLNSDATQKLRVEMSKLGLKELGRNPLLQDREVAEEAVVLLEALAMEM